ncbi:MAG TPA: UTRA domain-containing protein [Paracoccaceae bacterium]|nr:UTRA domain-containing protein [Paracoccaceae bacterium]
MARTASPPGPCISASIRAARVAWPAGTQVHALESLSLAGGQPLPLFRPVFPAIRFPGLAARLDAGGPVTASLPAEGLAGYARGSTRIPARTARGTSATLRMLAQGAPGLRTVAVKVDGAGRPAEYGTTWSAGERVTPVVVPE